MAINDIVQTIAEARVDARSLSEFVFKPAGFKVTRRLAPTIDTLQFYVNSLSSAVTEAEGKVAYIEETVQDAINNTAIEGGVIADTFVVVDGNQNQRDVNQKTARKYVSVAAMIADDKLKVGRYVATLGYYEAGDGGGNDYLIVAADTGVADDGTLIDLANGLQAQATFVNAHPNAMQFGAKGHDKTLDSQPRLQAYIKWCEVNGFSSGYIPTFKQAYKLDAPLVLELGDFRLFGDKGMQYNHPWVDISIPRDFRKGNFVVSENVRCALDLGASQRHTTLVSPTNPMTKNYAQAWTVDGLSVVGEKGAYGRSSDAIQWTASQNGPHRPVVLNSLSAYGVSRAFFMEPLPPNVSNQLSNLQISDCTFSFCDYAVYTVGSGIYGAHIHDNNFEANSKGCVVGNFNGYVAIKNNMLENTKNPVDIYMNSTTQVVTEGNYFEYHPTSDYLYSFTGQSPYSPYTLRLGADIYSSGIPTYTLNIKGKGVFQVLAVNDTLISAVDGDMCLGNQTTLLEGGRSVAVKGDFKAAANYGTCIFNNKSLVRQHNNAVTDTASGYKFSAPDNTDPDTVIQPSPFGDINVRDFADSFNVVFDENINGKFVEVNILVKPIKRVYSTNSPTQLSANTGKKGSGSYVVGITRGGDFIWQSVGNTGEWQVVTIVMTHSQGVNSIWYRLPEELRGSFLFGGAATKVYGNAKDVDGNGIIYKGIKGYLPKVNKALPPAV